MSDDNQDICYICGDGGDLIRPCQNFLCSARIHPQCLEEQYLANKKNCGNCQQPIYYRIQNEIFDTRKCCIEYTKIIYTLFIIFGGSVTIFLLAFGQSITYHTTNSTNIKCDYEPFIIGIVVFYIAIFFYIPKTFCTPCSFSKKNIFYCKIFSKMKYKSYVSMGVLFIVSVLLLLLDHLIGHYVIKSMYDKEMFFNCNTCIAGSVIYSIIIGFFFIVGVIHHAVSNIYYNTKNEFYINKYEYGVKLDNLEQTYLLSKVATQ